MTGISQPMFSLANSEGMLHEIIRLDLSRCNMDIDGRKDLELETIADMDENPNSVEKNDAIEAKGHTHSFDLNLTLV